MTPDERNLLQSFLRDLNNTQVGMKDVEADNLIVGALRANPDAAYLLVQHAIMSDQALHAAQGRIADLENQMRQSAPPAPSGSTSFLGGQGPWSPSAPQAQSQPQSGGFMGSGPFSSGGGLGSFLRSAGTTAAGVAGGAMLFEGLSGLFGGHGGGFGGGFGGGGFGGFGGGYGQPMENVTINEYGDGGDNGGGYDDDNGGGYDDN